MKHTHFSSSRGSVLIFALVVTAITSVVTIGFLNYFASAIGNERAALASAQALAIAEAGVDKAVYELNQNSGYSGENDTALGNGVFSVSVANIDSGTKRVTATGYVPNSTSPTATKKIQVNVSIDTETVAFSFGVQSGNGGIFLENSASVIGNVYSNGPISGQSDNVVQGTVVSAGPSGLIDGVYATSSAYAHTIRNSIIDEDAYFQTITNTTVGGVQYSGSTDKSTTTLPISDELIEEWKAAAVIGGVHTAPCPYVISTTITIGPKKINCDLTIQGTGNIVTLNGPIWVQGNVIVKNSPTIKVSATQSGKSIPIIADKPSDRLVGSKIEIENSAAFEGSGNGSYVLLISQNNSAENGGSNKAIEVKNTVNGDLLVYAGHGEIDLAQNINLREVTSWRIRARNSAQIVYKTGLGNTLFPSGPGGSWAVVPGTYAITR